MTTTPGSSAHVIRNLWSTDTGPTDFFNLHTPAVQQVDLQQFYFLDVPAALHSDVVLATQMLTDPSLHAGPFERSRWLWSPDTAPTSRMTTRHIQQMSSAQLLAHADEDMIGGFAIISALAEYHKQRFRTIIDTLLANALLPPAPQMHLRGIGRLKQCMASMNWAGSVDMRSWYHQLPLDRRVACYMGIRTKKQGWLIPTHGPMGHVWMPFVGHTLTSAIAIATARAVCVEQGVSMEEIVIDVIIDNVLIAGKNKQIVTAIYDRIFETAASVNATIGDHTPPAQSVTHRGMVFDLAGDVKRVSLKPAFIDKAVTRLSHALGDAALTPAHWQSIAGQLAWARAVVFGDTVACDDFHLWRWVARVAASSPMRRVHHPPSVHAAAVRWRDVLRSNPSATLDRDWSVPDGILVTDAMKQGPFASWGAVYISPNGTISTASGSFEFGAATMCSINELECRAIGLGMDALDVHDANIFVVADNVSALFALIKAHSRSFRLQQAAAAVLRTAASRQLRMRYRYIKSADNPTDGLSRGRPFNRRDRQLCEQLAGETGWCAAGAGAARTRRPFVVSKNENSNG